MEQNRDAQFEKMTTQPIPSLIARLAVPTVLSMMITGIYNTADTYFVSQLGKSASGAVGVVFSLMAIIQAVGFTLGMGSGSIISRKLGEQKNEEANCIGTSAFVAALVFGVLVAVFGLLLLEPLVNALGATPTIRPYAMDYARWILIGAPIISACFVMNNIMRAEGHATFSAIAMTSGGLVNILLDPIFIFVFKMGTSGAAIATLISQCVSFIIFIQFFIRRKGTVVLSPKFISRKGQVYTKIIGTGLPSLFRQGLASIATILLNTSARVYGDAAISAMAITTKIIMLSGGIMVGIGQGFSPVAGYNYGAKIYSRVRQAFKFTVCVSFAFLFALASVLFIFAPQIICWFLNDAEVIEIGTFALRAQAAGLPLHAIIISTNMLMQSTGKNLQASFLSMNRQGVYFIPLIFILPRVLHLTGVEITQAISDVLSALTAIPYMIWFFRKLGKEQKTVYTNTSIALTM